MLPVSLVGVWADSRPAILTSQWLPVTPAFTEHYFLVVSRQPDGTVSAFVRNPEYNVGVFVRTRTVAVAGAALTLSAPGRDPIAGAVNANGTLTLRGVAPDDSDLVFHRAKTDDLVWFFPLPTASWDYRRPNASEDGWPTATLQDEGMHEAPFGQFINGIATLRSPLLRSPYIQSISVERHGALVLDQYFYGFSPQTTHDLRSAGKSVTTLMIGKAIETTHAFTPATPVLSLLKSYLPVKNDGAWKRKMTVSDLMTMSSGLACNDNDDSSPGNEDIMQSQPAGTDWYRYTLDLPMLGEPGMRALYCSAGINLLGAILTKETRTPLDRYFADNFATPMQFGRYALWLMPPPANAPYMAGGDRMRPRDFLKFGALLLNRGRWNGEQIVDPGWLAQSVAPRSAPEGEGDRYGYGWHLQTVAVDGRDYSVISAGGNGGQLLIVVPSLDAAVMVTAGNYNQYVVWRNFLRELVNVVVEACS